MRKHGQAIELLRQSKNQFISATNSVINIKETPKQNTNKNSWWLSAYTVVTSRPVKAPQVCDGYSQTFQAFSASMAIGQTWFPTLKNAFSNHRGTYNAP